MQAQPSRPQTLKATDLLSSQEMPPVMRIPFILNGYRQLYQPWTFYWRSLFRIHNETLNVWTHLLGALLIFWEVTAVVAQFGDRWPMDTELAVFYAVCALVTHLASALTHLLHSRSCSVHMFVFFCDYAGIGVSALAIGLCVFSFCSPPAYAAFQRPFFLPLIAIVSILSSSVICYYFATLRRKYTALVRTLMFTPISSYFMWTFATFIHKFYLRSVQGAAVDLQLNHLAHMLILASAFAVYITRVPERFLPGLFDICGQSHHLFHCGVSLSQWWMVRAIRQDIERRSPFLYSRQHEPIPMSQVWPTWGFVILFFISNIVYLHRRYCRHEASFLESKEK